MRKPFSFLLVFVAIFLLASCDIQPSTHAAQQAVMEDTARKMIAAVPPPSLEYSLERENIRERYVRFSDRNKVSYIYLVSYGNIMAFYPIIGKISSVNSYMTPMETVLRYGESGTAIVEAPSLDGTYGTNGEAIFFFTADTNSYVEWNGEYMLVDQPLQLTQPPVTIRNLDE